jgi:hypothetical protein
MPLPGFARQLTTMKIPSQPDILDANVIILVTECAAAAAGPDDPTIAVFHTS